MNKLSQTQLSNFLTAGGILVFLLAQMGIVFPAENAAYVLYALWSLGWTIYNFYQRYQKGDLTLGGFRKM